MTRQGNFRRRWATGIIGAGVAVLFTLPVQASLKTQGSGKKTTLVRSQFTVEQQPRYDLFANKCTHCHSMARPIKALQTGITPVTGGDFERVGIKRYVIRMMRKEDSDMGRMDAKEIIKFLTYARELAKQ